jgi:hypothetical protein
MTLHTRRAALPATTRCGSTPAIAASHSTSVNPRLLRAMDLYDEAEKAASDFEERIHAPALGAFNQAVNAEVGSATTDIPHEMVRTTFINAFGEEVRLSTDRIGAGAAARKVRDDPSWSDMGDEDWRAAHCELANALDRRDAALAEQAANHAAIRDRLRREHGIKALLDRSETLSNRCFSLWNAALNVPARGIDDVAAKLDFAVRHGDNDSEVVLECIRADVLHLAKRGSEAQSLTFSNA